MFCWSCGHANPDTHKFCGECGKGLFKPEKTVHEIGESKNFKSPTSGTKEPDRTSPPVVAALPIPETTKVVATSRPPEPPPAPVNPLVEEPRVIHENPLAQASAIPPAPPVRIHDRVPNRITGPSFLGLSDDGGARTDDGSYLLDESAESGSSWRGYVVLAVLVVLALVVIRNWAQVRAIATDSAQKMGVTDSAKRTSTLPERVTASNESPVSSSETAAAPDDKTAPSKPDATDDSKPKETAKLEKPQSDSDETEGKSAVHPDTAALEKPSAGTEKPVSPVYDNSQLELAQKYLQGRGVPQDCNRGLDLLRSAAKQPNPKARTQMAALYVSGHCVTQDLAQAYNWFSQAQELEPHNRLIERNMDSLWARMSDEERRKVLR
jgi:hypothetical protein